MTIGTITSVFQGSATIKMMSKPILDNAATGPQSLSGTVPYLVSRANLTTAFSIATDLNALAVHLMQTDGSFTTTQWGSPAPNDGDTVNVSIWNSQIVITQTAGSNPAFNNYICNFFSEGSSNLGQPFSTYTAPSGWLSGTFGAVSPIRWHNHDKFLVAYDCGLSGQGVLVDAFGSIGPTGFWQAPQGLFGPDYLAIYPDDGDGFNYIVNQGSFLLPAVLSKVDSTLCTNVSDNHVDFSDATTQAYFGGQFATQVCRWGFYTSGDRSFYDGVPGIVLILISKDASKYWVYFFEGIDPTADGLITAGSMFLSMAGPASSVVMADGLTNTPVQVLIPALSVFRPVAGTNAYAAGTVTSGAPSVVTSGAASIAHGGFLQAPGFITIPPPPPTTRLSLIVGGWAPAPLLPGASAVALDLADQTKVLTVAPGTASIWAASTDQSDDWSVSQTVSGLPALAAGAWVPNGTQALAGAPSADLVQVMSYILGTLAADSTVAVSGASRIAVAPDSASALVVQSGLDAVMPLVNTAGVWSVGTPLALPSAADVAFLDDSATAYAAYASGVAVLLMQSSGSWIVGETISLGFVPTLLAIDRFGTLYVAGSGAFAAIQVATVVSSGVFSGDPTSLAVADGRAMVAVGGNVQILGQSADDTWTVMSSAAFSLGSALALGLANVSIFAAGSGATQICRLLGPQYALVPAMSGAVGLWDGTAWRTVGIGIDRLPSALCLDASGNVRVATSVNDLWAIDLGGVVLASGSIPQYPQQRSGVPISPSAMTVADDGSILVATSIPGVLVQVP